MEAPLTERRRHCRVSREAAGWREMRLRTGDPLLIVDISAGGALVETSRRLLPGTTVAFQVNTADSERTIRARIVRCAVHALWADGCVRYRGALAFQDPDHVPGVTDPVRDHV